MSVIPVPLAKALADKLYDKQRAATHKIERLVLDALDLDDEQVIYQLIAELSTDYATSEKESSRIGGLVALAATAVALTHINIRPFLPHMVPPMVSALSDGESKVRYFACESLYNVAKVSRGHVLRWFNDIFDGLARVTADSVKTVKDGADYLDRLVKDIVAEQAATCLDWYEDGGIADDTSESVGRPRGPRLAFSLDRFVPLLSERMHTYKPSTRLYLIEWIRVLDSVPGLDLITYLPEFLDGLVRFLGDPNDDVRNKTQSLLGELLAEIRECVEIQGLADDLEEGEDGWGRPRANTVQTISRRPSRAPSAASSIPVLSSRAILGSTANNPTSAVTQHHHHYYHRSDTVNRSSSSVSLMTSALSTSGGVDEQRMAARRKKIRADRLQQSGVLVPLVSIDFGRCVDILVPHLESSDQEIQALALSWIHQFTWLCPHVIVRSVPRLVNAVLPSVSHPVPALRHSAEDLGLQLYDLVAAADDPVRRHLSAQPVSHRPVSPACGSARSVFSAPQVPQQPPPVAVRSRTSSVLNTTAGTPSAYIGSPAIVPSSANDDEEEEEKEVEEKERENEEEGVDVDCDVSDMGIDNILSSTFVIDEPFNYEQAATGIMELFAKNVHEPTKVSGMRWLLLLHRKAPWRILTPEDMSFPVLLKMLSDSSEQVVKLDLELFAQISLYSQRTSEDDTYLSRFLGSLLQMFATDRVLLETRAALMVRQLCHVLDPQLVFCLFARLLVRPRFSPDEESEFEEEEGLADLEFISVMVQHLSWILVTAPETECLRLLLREYNADLVQQMPLLPSVRDAAGTAKDPQRVGRSRGASLSPPADADPTVSESPQQKPTKLVRTPATTTTTTTTTTTITTAGKAGIRAPSGGGALRSRSSTVEVDKVPRSARSGKTPSGAAPQIIRSQRQQQMAALGVRGRNILAQSLQRVEQSIERSQVSHSLFCALFRAWSHNPAACLTLCLLSQHYDIASELISVFGAQTTPHDLTVSFLVQLDKLVQLIESPVFTYLRLQLLDPLRNPALVRALYGLLMMLPQSSAFAILRNRLSTVAMLPIMASSAASTNRVGAGGEAGPPAAQQVHYHYHHHAHSTATFAHQPDVNSNGAGVSLLSSATGVAPADLGELMSLLTVLSAHPSPPPPLPAVSENTSGSRRTVPSAAALLQQIADLQQHVQTTESPVDDSDPGGGQTRISASDAMRLVDEYCAVRRRYAQALARHQSR